MKISEIFRNPIDRRIEEVIKVDLDEAATVAAEIDEYVVTDHLTAQFEALLDRYQETIFKPDEGTNIWVSGFFGSGKSSFAKVFGYLLSNPTLGGRSAIDRFMARTDSRRIQALLNTIQSQAPTRVVFVDLATSKNVMREGEHVVRPLYRALLQDLGYSRNEILAELEFNLESDGRLEEFVAAYGRVPGVPDSWSRRRNVLLAKGEASHALHLIQPELYPQPDSWARSNPSVEINSNWFAERAVELLRRRAPGAKRLVFVVDEAGQYVARSADRMLDLQGLAEAVSKQRGRLWLLVTSQEKLDDIVESLEGRRIELARVQARFPSRVDLVPADIDEVAGKRVLQKSDAGQRAVRAALAPHRHMLSNNVSLESPTRSAALGEEEFVRLYPLLPYQIQLLIDAVSARRGSAAPMIGGSNRTLIKLAQQLVVDPRSGCASAEVGTLVTIDRAYGLLESIIPTQWQAEITQIGDRYGDESPEAAVAKALALCADVRALPLNAANLAALLHPGIDAESVRPAVDGALDRLVRDEAVRHGDGGYRLQTPEEKDWEKQRHAIAAKPADLIRLRRELFKTALEGLTATEAGRTFKVALVVEGEKQFDGELTLEIDESDPTVWTDIRTRSREVATTIWWAYSESSETSDLLEEAHRSRRMITSKEGARLSPTDLELLAEERGRQQRTERLALAALQRDALGGQFIFQGTADDVSGAELKAVAKEAVRSRIEDIYPQLSHYSAPVSKGDVRSILQAANLKGLPDYLGPDGIGLIRLTPTGAELASDSQPLSTVIAAIRERATYGTEATGSWLLERFGRPPYGATVEVAQAVAAASVRCGVVEAVASGARLRRSDDPRLERVFSTIPSFRTASFVPQQDEVGIEIRADLAERIQKLTGERPPLPAEDLARAVRATFLPAAEASRRIAAAFRAVGLPVPPPVSRTIEITDRLAAEDDGDALRTAVQAWADLAAGRVVSGALEQLLEDDGAMLRDAADQSRASLEGFERNMRADQARLQDLVAAGDLVGHLGEVRALTGRIRSARLEAEAAARKELETAVETQVLQLRERFTDVPEEVITEAIGDLQRLLPAADGAAYPELLRAKLGLVPALVGQVRHALEDVATGGHLVRVKVSEIAPEPIGTREDFEHVVDVLREQVEVQLTAGKRVKLE